VRLFRVLPPDGTPRKASPRLTFHDKPSIVVLPFHNLSDDPEQDYFADGIVEDITTALSRFHSLFVIARNSAFTYKGRAVDIRQVGRELGARYVVGGSLRKVGNRLRVSGQAIQTDTGANLWAERYDRDLSDIFALQDEMTGSIVGALVPIIQRAEIDRARHKPRGSLDAYDLTMFALSAEASLTREGNVAARELLDAALALDSHFVPALLLQDACLATAAANGWLPPETLSRCLQVTRLAVQLDPEDAEALAALAMRAAMLTSGEEQAIALAERAIAANPHSALVLRNSASAYLHAGRVEEAIGLFERALRMAPSDPAAHVGWAGLALAMLALARYPDAISAARRALQHHSGSVEAMRVLAAALALTERVEDAKKTLTRLRHLHPGGAIADMPIGETFHDRGGCRLTEGLHRAGLSPTRESSTETQLAAARKAPVDDESTILLAPRKREPRRVLLVRRPGEPDREVLIGRSPIVLGRAPDSGVVLNDPKVSRAHCQIAPTAGEVIATDLQSTNGTLIDDRRLEGKVRLIPGTVLKIGPFQIEYQHRDTPDPDTTQMATNRALAPRRDSVTS
jgi:TolB-like protein